MEKLLLGFRILAKKVRREIFIIKVEVGSLFPRCLDTFFAFDMRALFK